MHTPSVAPNAYRDMPWGAGSWFQGYTMARVSATEALLRR